MVTTVYQDLPWGKIRREWESTQISLAGLSRKYRIRSGTTLERRCKAEKWTRDVGADQQGAGTYQPNMPAPGTEVARLGGPAVPLTADDPLDAERLLTGRTLAQAEANQRHTQVALATAIQLAGLRLLQRFLGVVQPPSDNEAGEALALGNLQRLIRVNPDRETLANLGLAACKMIEMGVTLEKRALAMEVKASPAPAEAYNSKQAMAMLERMDPETALRMRAWAVRIQQEQRQAQIDQAKQVNESR
jgi:hypothetical protein